MMKVIDYPIEKLTPYSRNSRTHDDDQVNQIASSIREFGFNNPVLVDEGGVIIAGHGRYKAAKLLGMKTVPTIELKNLTDAKKRAYIIADNKIALNAGWDKEMLMLEIEEISNEGIDIDLTGFSDEEISKLFDETSDIKIVDDEYIEESRLEKVIIKFDSNDRNNILNELNRIVEKYNKAEIWVSDE